MSGGVRPEITEESISTRIHPTDDPNPTIDKSPPPETGQHEAFIMNDSLSLSSATATASATSSASSCSPSPPVVLEQTAQRGFGDADPNAILYEDPSPFDIICGRGKNTGHRGNNRFHEIICSWRKAYQQAQRRDDKTQITADIVASLGRDTPVSRFLLKDRKTQKWFEVSADYAKEKVSHALRSGPKDKSTSRKSALNNTSINNNKMKKCKKLYHGARLRPELEATFLSILEEQRRIFKRMIENDERKISSTTARLALSLSHELQMNDTLS